MQCRYCGMDNPDSIRSCISCDKLLQRGSPWKRMESTGLSRASHRSHFARPADLGFVAPDPVFRSSKFVKGSRLTGSASTVSIKAQASGPRASPIPEQRAAGEFLHASQHAHSEPYLGDHRSGVANSSEEELQRQYAFYERFNVPPSRSRPSIVYVVVVFAIGAAVGMTGAWWGSQSSGDALENELPHALRNSRAPVHSSVVKGIDPRELPYDGLSPIPDEQVARVPSSGIDPEERPYAELSSSSRVAQQNKPSSDMQQALKSRAAPDERTTRNTPAADGKKTVAAKVSQKHRSTSRRIAKDREIERIRQQAAEELKKKTDKGRSVKQQADSSAHRSARRHDVPTVIDKSTRTRAMLASCEHAENFFLREKCKWRLCGGSWGEHGCPSYKTQASSY